MSHKSQLIKNTAIIAIGKISTQVLSYILLPLYTAKMAVEEYGTYDLVCTLSIFLCPLISLLMEESMFRFLIDAKDEQERKDVISQTLIYTGIGIAIFIPLTILYFNIFTNYSGFFIFTFIAFVLSNMGIWVSNALARGLSNIKLYSVSNFILGISTIILTIVILLAKPTAEGLLWANLLANFIASFFIFFRLKLKRFLGKYNKRLMKKMVKYSFPLVPNSISWSIINMSDRIIITQLIDSGANGIYAMASRFPNIINVLYSYFYTAWKESAAQIIKEDNRDKYYNSIYHDITKFLFAVTICLIAAMPFAFPIFINKNYNDAYQYIPLIMIATYYSCMSSSYGGIFGALKKTKIMGTTTLVAAILNLIVDFALIKFIGIYAACISTLFSNLFIYVYRKIKLKRYLKLTELNKNIAIGMLAIICFTYYTKFIAFVPNIWYWILNVISLLIAIVYSLIINRQFIKLFIRKLKSRIS